MATAQAQLWPDATSTTIIRFAHPLTNIPPDNFIAVNRCVTYLLFPFVTGNKVPGFTTGLAIANTSSDDAVFVTGGGVAASRTATAQAGAITLYGWHGSTKDATGSSTTTFAPSYLHWRGGFGGGQRKPESAGGLHGQALSMEPLGSLDSKATSLRSATSSMLMASRSSWANTIVGASSMWRTATLLS